MGLTVACSYTAGGKCQGTNTMLQILKLKSAMNLHCPEARADGSQQHGGGELSGVVVPPTCSGCPVNHSAVRGSRS